MLAGSAVPGGFESSDEQMVRIDLNFFKSEGIHTLVSLQEMDPLWGAWCAAAGIRWIHYPIPDFSTPSDIATFDTLVRSLIESLNNKEPVCVHCRAGIGRTGMLLSCIMGKFLLLSPKAAIAAVRATRMALDTPLQEKFVGEYLRDQS